MAQYKVPQDVEADDKLLGPFSFRQFVYLLVAGGLIAAAVGLFQLFPLLAVIPLPPVLLFLALALPLKKDQPMETYLAALVSYYLKPHKRVWMTGQKETTIVITAPKIVEDSRTRNITGEEATHRLSFLADIVDTGGYAIKGSASNSMREDLIAEANATTDMFETSHFDSLQTTIAKDENERHEEVMREMRAAIEKNDNFSFASFSQSATKPATTPAASPTITAQPGAGLAAASSTPAPAPAPAAPAPSASTSSVSSVFSQTATNSGNASTAPANHSIMELANNPDFSVATIAKEANRIKERGEGEVFISLH